ncbi:hypothetical protein DVH05_004211 [Phytophthora capsici]|nr:hypothetical protein DVH05_004211 [Phytophthora capsici]
MPSPLAKEKDNGLHIATPRSIIADALSRTPLSALPPLDSQSPPSTGKKKKIKQSSDVKGGLSPTDPFFSPRFRFDSDTTGSKVKKLVSISPRTTSVEVQAPPSSKAKRERRKSSVKKPPTTVETSRKVAKASDKEVQKATATGKVSDEVQMEVPDTNEPQHDLIGTASDELKPSEPPNSVLGDTDRSVSMVLANVIDKLVEKEEGISPIDKGSPYLEEQQNGRAVKDDALGGEPVLETHTYELHVESPDKPTTNCLEDNGGADGEQHQHEAVETEVGLNDVNSAQADPNDANTDRTEDTVEGGNEETFDDAQNDPVEYAPPTVTHNEYDESNAEDAIEDVAEAGFGEDPTCGEAPAESTLEEQLDIQDQMDTEHDHEQGFEQDLEEKQFSADDTGELPASAYEAQDEQYAHAVLEENLPLTEENLATENYDAGDYENYSSPTVETRDGYEAVQQEWDAVDQQHEFVDQSDYVATCYEQQGYEVTDEDQGDWNQVEQAEPCTTEDAAEYNSLCLQEEQVVQQPTEGAVTVDADQILVQESDPSDSNPNI